MMISATSLSQLKIQFVSTLTEAMQKIKEKKIARHKVWFISIFWRSRQLYALAKIVNYMDLPKRKVLMKTLRGHSQIKNCILCVDTTSRSVPPPPNLDANIYFWRKESSTFSQINITIVNSHQNSILYIDRNSWNCNIIHSIHIACTILPAIAMDCWRPRQ